MILRRDLLKAVIVAPILALFGRKAKASPKTPAREIEYDYDWYYDWSPAPSTLPYGFRPDSIDGMPINWVHMFQVQHATLPVPPVWISCGETTSYRVYWSIVRGTTRTEMEQRLAIMQYWDMEDSFWKKPSDEPYGLKYWLESK